MVIVAEMDKCLSGYKMKYRENEAGSSKDSRASSSREKQYIINLNAENTIQNMYFRLTNTDVDGEERTHVYFL
jgi:hypothetical protein